jgi:hypothetical protein
MYFTDLKEQCNTSIINEGWPSRDIRKWQSRETRQLSHYRFFFFNWQSFRSLKVLRSQFFVNIIIIINAPIWIDPEVAVNQDEVPLNNSIEFSNYIILSHISGSLAIPPFE